METEQYLQANTGPLVRVPNSPNAAPVLSRLPDTLSGTVRARRRRILRRVWHNATARLKGTALVVESSHGVLAALDVQEVTLLSYDRVFIRSETPVGSIELKLVENRNQWLAALQSIAGGRNVALSDFLVISPIGKGGGGAVYLVKEKRGDGTPLAMKVVQKHDAFYSDGSLRHALDERVVLELVRGFPFVIMLRHAFQTETALYMVSDFCQGGDLRTLLKRQKRGRLPEDRARVLMAQIILALEHVHSLNVIYRDLKPENVLLSADGDVRLCDFGLSKVLSTGRFGRTRSFCGSTSYMSPQIVTGRSYGIATDLWSLGALFYRMLVGRAPFDEAPKLGARNDAPDIQRRIQLDDISFPSFLSEPAREMLDGLLRKAEEDRTNLQDLKEGLFFRDIDWDQVLDDGYRRAANPGGEALGGELDNFDAERLRSHGVALEDKELIGRPRARKLEDKTVDLGNTGFVKRSASALANLSLRRRSDMQRKQSSTSIVGFGFSSAADLKSVPSLSDVTQIASGSEASNNASEASASVDR